MIIWETKRRYIRVKMSDAGVCVADEHGATLAGGEDGFTGIAGLTGLSSTFGATISVVCAGTVAGSPSELRKRDNTGAARMKNNRR